MATSECKNAVAQSAHIRADLNEEARNVHICKDLSRSYIVNYRSSLKKVMQQNLL